MNCYSRYFSTTDNLTNERLGLKPKLMRSTSLQDGSKSCASKTTVDFSAPPFSFEEVEDFEQLKANSVKQKKSTEIKCEKNIEEKESNGRNDRLFSAGSKQLGHMDKNSRDLSEDSKILRADVYTTVKPPKQHCECFKENSKTVIHESTENGKGSEKCPNALQGYLVEDVPTEIKCTKCHLEIQEEWRRRKMVIESWMEFFGSRGTRNSIYTSASSV